MMFKIVGENLVADRKQPGPDREVVLGVWLPTNEEQMMRLMSRVYRLGWADKRSQINAVLQS